MSDRKVALVVGASRGLGLGLVNACLSRGWEVIATARDARGRGALEALGDKTALSIADLDANASGDIGRLRKALAGRTLDVLFVNAGIVASPAGTVEAISTQHFVDAMITNALSPLRVIGALHDLVDPAGIVAVMSSNMASISENTGGGWEIYRASKAALNQMLKSYAARNRDGRTYLCISPGWVRTDMGGEHAPLDVEASVTGIVNTILARSGVAPGRSCCKPEQETWNSNP